MKSHLWIVFFILILGMACGGSPTAKIDLEIALGEKANLLSQIDQDIDNALSTGIYFEFRKLNCPPVKGFDDEADPSALPFSYPSREGAGIANPMQSSFEIDTSSLEANAYYSVTMVARYRATPQERYMGEGDCPLNLSLGQNNRITICFGDSQTVPHTCTGAIGDWKNCPFALECP